jgi:hypothetical protein
VASTMLGTTARSFPKTDGWPRRASAGWGGGVLCKTFTSRRGAEHAKRPPGHRHRIPWANRVAHERTGAADESQNGRPVADSPEQFTVAGGCRVEITARRAPGLPSLLYLWDEWLGWLIEPPGFPRIPGDVHGIGTDLPWTVGNEGCGFLIGQR